VGLTHGIWFMRVIGATGFSKLWRWALYPLASSNASRKTRKRPRISRASSLVNVLYYSIRSPCNAWYICHTKLRM